MAFKRYDGFIGSLPQKFINTQIPKCPMCGSAAPDWTINQKMGLWASRYLFKCSACEAIISSNMTDVTGLGNSILSNDGLFKKLSGKKLKAYFKIDEVGKVQATNQYQGKEMTLDDIVELANTL